MLWNNIKLRLKSSPYPFRSTFQNSWNVYFVFWTSVIFEILRSKTVNEIDENYLRVLITALTPLKGNLKIVEKTGLRMFYIVLFSPISQLYKTQLLGYSLMS